MSALDAFKTRFYRDVFYGVKTCPSRAINLAPIKLDDADTERRRAYLTSLEGSKKFKNSSLKRKVKAKRALKAKKVPQF